MQRYKFENCTVTINQSAITAKAIDDSTEEVITTNPIQDIDNTNNELKSLSDEVSTLSAINVELTGEIKSLSDEVSTLSAINVELTKELTHNINTLENDNKTLSADNDELTKELTHQNKKFSDLFNSCKLKDDTIIKQGEEIAKLTEELNSAKIQTTLQTAKPIRRVKIVSDTPIPANNNNNNTEYNIVNTKVKEIETSKVDLVLKYVLIDSKYFDDKDIDTWMDYPNSTLGTFDVSDPFHAIEILNEKNDGYIYNLVKSPYNAIKTNLIQNDIEYIFVSTTKVDIETARELQIAKEKEQDKIAKDKTKYDILPIQTSNSISIAHPNITGYNFNGLGEGATRVNSKLILGWISKKCINVDKTGLINVNDESITDLEYLETLIFMDDFKLSELLGFSDENQLDVFDMLLEVKAIINLENNFEESTCDVEQSDENNSVDEKELSDANEAFEKEVLGKSTDDVEQSDEKEVLGNSIDWANVKLPTDEMIANFKEENPQGRAGLKKVLVYTLDNANVNLGKYSVAKLAKLTGVELESKFREIMLNNAKPSTKTDKQSKVEVTKPSTKTYIKPTLSKFQDKIRDSKPLNGNNNNLEVIKSSGVLELSSLNHNTFFKDVTVKLFPIGSRAIYLKALMNLNINIEKASDNDLLIIYKYIINTLLNR